MRLRIKYKTGAEFEVEATEPEDFESLYAIAQRTLWGDNAHAMTLEEADKWLGLKK